MLRVSLYKYPSPMVCYVEMKLLERLFQYTFLTKKSKTTAIARSTSPCEKSLTIQRLQFKATNSWVFYIKILKFEAKIVTKPIQHYHINTMVKSVNSWHSCYMPLPQSAVPIMNFHSGTIWSIIFTKCFVLVNLRRLMYCIKRVLCRNSPLRGEGK